MNSPEEYERYVCQDSFWNSTGWANELCREIRRRERAAKKAVFATLLAKALAAGRWECDRCGGENMLSRVKCYQCSTLRSRHRGDDESSDSERETGWWNRRSARCQTLREGKSGVAGSTKRKCASAEAFTTNLAAGIGYRGRSKALRPRECSRLD